MDGLTDLLERAGSLHHHRSAGENRRELFSI